MSDRNLQYSDGIKPEHSNPNPTIRGNHDWNRGSNPGQGGVLLLDGTRSDALTTNTTGRNLCSPERLLATRINDPRYQGVVRRDIPEAQGPLGGFQRDERNDQRAVALIRAYEVFTPEVTLEDLNLEPTPTFGPGVHIAIIGASVVAVGIWYGIFAAAHAIYLAVR